ncbi:MAG: MBL fold metallo-hydrolase, partial [Verrucomicrobia bacterium]|nr:MBL fold metallo-hydrolase [Verrucomicrobiota bacterium]
MKIPLEDLFEDIVGKAQRGLQVSDQELCQRARLALEEFRLLKKGSGTPASVPGIAEALGLGPNALTASYAKSWYPTDVPEIDGTKQFNSPLIDMTVNAYLVWDPENKEAAVFDTGADATELLAFIDSTRLSVKYLFLTHTHQDHVADLGAIAKKTQAEIF